MDVAAWLQGLGLERYEQLFRDHEIDWEVLQKLTSEDLKEIGVSAIGHRRKLLDAIAALDSKMPGAAATTAARAAPAQVDAERRQLTVIFCDLVSSTALSARLDPEDLREVISAYHGAVREEVGRFDGFVAKYMGDGILVYFGYPQAHEDDPERAVRAGLGLIDAVHRLDVRSVELQARVGIATGLVVVGDLIGEGSAQEQSVVGETPNLAARLQALARPGEIVIPENTRRLVGNLFEYAGLGEVEVKGLPAPVQAFRVLRESGISNRFEALRSEAAPLIGRDEELDLLQQRWELAKGGKGTVVLVSGEPGIGKSRLTAALWQRIQNDQHTRLRLFCSPHHQDSPLHPFTDQLERAAGFGREHTVEQKVDRLRNLLAPGAVDDVEVSLLAELLSLPNTASDLNLSPQRKREKLFEALLHQLESVARNQPILMVFEDAHWIDPTSRELLDLTFDLVSRLPVLLIVTFRPEFENAWGGQPHVEALTLNRLTGRDGAALVERVAGDGSLPPDSVDEIVERADGIPLFLEELTKAVLESRDRENRVGAVLAASPAAGLRIPATLHASLLARLDRLGLAAKETAQVGAVIGRDFGYDLIEQVAQRPAAELLTGLKRLGEANLLFRRGDPPRSFYFFKHALVQDTAYGTLLRGKRRELHARVAKVLEEQFPHIIATQPEVLAHHYTQAGLVGPAIEYWRKAGERALKQSAAPEATQHLTRGIELISALSAERERDRAELRLHLALGPAIRAVKGHAAEETLRVFSRARDLLVDAVPLDQQMAVRYGLWSVCHLRSEHAIARTLAQECLALGEEHQDAKACALAHQLMGSSLFGRGEFVEARYHAEQSIEASKRVQGDLTGLHSSHYRAAGLSTLAMILWPLGYAEQAIASSEEAISVARDAGHVPLKAYTLCADSLLVTAFGAVKQPDTARLETAVTYCIEHGAADYQRWCSFYAALAAAKRGDPERGIDTMRSAIEASHEINAELYRPMHLGHLAVAHAGLGDWEVGLGLLNEALITVEKTQERFFEAELHRLRGTLLLKSGKKSEVEEALNLALVIARRQRARMWELRAATGLARLWGEQSRRSEARDLLAPIYGWFTEGFNTFDLKQAKALLDEL
jgi:class 3 adenylate cyclase/tetratricopeptide (TPR) repeat protein